MSKVAWVAGASGLVGGHLMRQLCECEDYAEVVALVRNSCSAEWDSHPKVTQQIVNYDDLVLPQHSSEALDLFCALGSTTRKTPDKTKYYTIDVNYPLNFAQAGQKQGARYFGLVSAHGANANSLSFYLRMKGELEKQLQTLAYPHLCIARPGLLKGERSEFRLAERLGEQVANLLPGNYKSILAQDVATSLVKSAQQQQASMMLLSSKQMQHASRDLNPK